MVLSEQATTFGATSGWRAECSLDRGRPCSFVSLPEVISLWPQLVPHLGRRSRPFWEFLLERWRTLGLVVEGVSASLSGLLPKESRGEVILDSPLEILANTLCAVLGRSELRDLVDLKALEQSGLRVEDALPIAVRKDGGATPGQVAWVLSTIQIGPDARIPGGGSGAELQGYLRGLIDRLVALSVPGPKA